MSKGATVKVVISYLSEEVLVTKQTDKKGQSIIRNIALKNWVTVTKASLHHKLLGLEFKDALTREVANGFKDYMTSLSSLKESSPDQLAVFSNRTV